MLRRPGRRRIAGREQTSDQLCVTIRRQDQSQPPLLVANLVSAHRQSHEALSCPPKSSSPSSPPASCSALTPGPNMSLILANTLTGGLRAGLVTLAGTTTGLALLVAAAAAGMSSVMVFMSEWFDVIRWVGALYLVYLGARQLWLLRRRAAGLRRCRRRRPAPISICEGVLVSLSNPKVLLFLGAFLPQFVDPARDPVAAALHAGRAVRRRAGRRRRRLHAGRGQGARPPSMPPACACSTAPPASSCCSAAWRWRWRAGRDSGVRVSDPPGLTPWHQPSQPWCQTQRV